MLSLTAQLTCEVNMSAISITTLPNELISQVLFSLSPQDLARTSRVCKNWHRLAYAPALWNHFDLGKVFPHIVRVFNEKVWSEHADLKGLGLSFEGILPLDNRAAIPLLARFFSNLEKEDVEIEGGAGVAILDIPQNLCRPGLEMIASSDAVNPIDLIGDGLVHTGSLTVHGSYRVLITNGNIKRRSAPVGLNRLTQWDRPKTLEDRPKILEAVALAILTLKSSQQTGLFTQFTRCQESLSDPSSCGDNDLAFLVGGFDHHALKMITSENSLGDSAGVVYFDGAWKNPLQENPAKF